MNAPRSLRRLPDDGQHGAWQVLARFAPALWRHRRALAVALACTLFAAAMTLLAPWPVKYIIDHALGGAPLPAPLAALFDDLSMRTVIVALGGMAALAALLGAIASAIEKNLEARVRERMTVELRDEVLAHIQSLSTHYRTRDRTGELALRLVDDVNQVVRLLTKSAPVTLRPVVTSLLVFVMMFRLDPGLGSLALAIVVVLVFVARVHARRLRETTRRKRSGEGSVAALAQEIIRGQPSVQALGAEQAVRERFGRENRASLEAGVAETAAAVAMERSLQIGNGLAVALMAVGGALRALEGTLTVGDLTVFLAYVVQLLKPIEKMNELAATTARGIARGEKLLQLLARPAAVIDAPDAVTIARARGLIEMRGVSFSYPPDGGETRPVLDRIDLRLAPGSFTVLTGPSGAGKSTLLHLLLRIVEPTAGEIALDGLPYARIRLASLRAQFAVMLQETHLFAGSLRAALQPADAPAVAERALWDALAQVALEDDVRALPEALDTPLGEAGVNLSGGQRARLSLARALLLDRPILLLDEPLANVDDESQRIIVDALHRIAAGRTCLGVSHQPALARIADRVVCLDACRLHAGVRPVRHERIAEARS
jgi:ABC-type multidrug transport system fused ATPase/permease subunit